MSATCDAQPPLSSVWFLASAIRCQRPLGHEGECSDGPARWTVPGRRGELHIRNPLNEVLLLALPCHDCGLRCYKGCPREACAFRGWP